MSTKMMFNMYFNITTVENQLRAKKKYQCPVLQENGCLLSFDNRPLACSNAYPCFSGELYYNYLERHRKKIDAQYTLLNKLFQKWTRGRNCDTCIT
jgi:hypothetical protein